MGNRVCRPNNMAAREFKNRSCRLKVFLVMRDEPDDEEVVAVFDTLESAENECARLTEVPWHGYRVKEFVVKAS